MKKPVEIVGGEEEINRMKNFLKEINGNSILDGKAKERILKFVKNTVSKNE